MKKRGFIDVPLPVEGDEVRHSVRGCPWSLLIVEHLRYMGVLSVNGCGHTGLCAPNHLRVYAPRDLAGAVWAKRNVDRMASFGVKAAVGQV